MNDMTQNAIAGGAARQIGPVILDLHNISLASAA